MSAVLFASGEMKFGNFQGNKLHGYAISIVPEGREITNCPNAKYYVGNFSNDNKSGTGTCYDKTGKLIYHGEFKDHKPVGTYPTTDNYASFKFQTIDYTNGDKYIGETVDGKRIGYGVYAWKDGRIWIGYWVNGERKGQGIDIASNGTFLTGYWDKDTRYSEPIIISSGTFVKTSQPQNVAVVTVNPSGSSSSSSSTSSSSSSGNQSSGTSLNPNGSMTTRAPGYESNYNPVTGAVTTTSRCPICLGKGQIQALNPMYGMDRANRIYYGSSWGPTVPMYTSQTCYGCNGAGSTTTTTYADPNASSSGSSGGGGSSSSSSSSSSSGGRLCDVCLGKGQTWVYTGGAGDNRTTVYCSVSGCDVKSPHRHETCNRCRGTGRL
jgi:hypothetical protein